MEGIVQKTKAFLDKLTTQEFINIPDTIEVTEAKSNNECLNCEWLGSHCAGPNAATMTVERICEFLQYSRLQKHWTYQRTADECNLSLITVKRTLTGQVKNPEFLTIHCLFEGLVGVGKYPCAKTIFTEQVEDAEQKVKTVCLKHAEEITAKNETIADLKLQLKESRETNATYRATIADLRAQVKKYESAAKKAQKDIKV
jgi:hypothetical protein